MAGKSKFQISRSLDERIKNFIESSNSGVEYNGLNINQLSSAYILGFHSANVTNYVGLTSNYLQHNAGCPVVGSVILKTPPSKEVLENELKSLLEPTREYFYSFDKGIGSHSKVDKNEHLYLIYSMDEETKQLSKRIYNLNEAKFADEQPKLSILDDSKIYNHSAVVRLSTVISLPTTLGADDVDKVKQLFSSDDANNLSIHLNKSTFSSKTPLTNQQPLESLYSHLDAPHDLEQMGDYLPQMTKEDKKKMIDKWRNKVKDQRVPLELELRFSEELNDKLAQMDLNKPRSNLSIEEFLYLHVNDSIAKSTRIILFLLRQKLDLLKLALNMNETATPFDTVEFCTFKPPMLNHFVPAVYLIPKSSTSSQTNYKLLAQLREQLHRAYLIPITKPAVRFSQRVRNAQLKTVDELNGYLCNVHVNLIEKSGIKSGKRDIIEGTYAYHHYLQDRIQDNGWGCAYRSLQTIISWFKHQAYIYSPDVEVRASAASQPDDIKSLREKLHNEARVPTHEEIQKVLVDIGDKQAGFVGSQKWIGSQEVCYVLQTLYNLDCKFISVNSGSELVYKARDLGQHFGVQSTPVMIGGGVLAHTIIGLDFNEKNGDISYLILDPHYTGGEDLNEITKKGWCGWKKNAFWNKTSFYNLCLPLRPIEF